MVSQIDYWARFAGHPVERQVRNLEVRGSNPLCSTITRAYEPCISSGTYLRFKQKYRPGPKDLGGIFVCAIQGMSVGFPNCSIPKKTMQLYLNPVLHTYFNRIQVPICLKYHIIQTTRVIRCTDRDNCIILHYTGIVSITAHRMKC